jgi:hypothetical protein
MFLYTPMYRNIHCDARTVRTSALQSPPVGNIAAGPEIVSGIGAALAWAF